MKATASPMTLYFDRKSTNSAHMPFGGCGGGVGLGSRSVRMLFVPLILRRLLPKLSPSISSAVWNYKPCVERFGSDLSVFRTSVS